MNQTYYAKAKPQQLIKDFFIRLWDTCRYVASNNRGSWNPRETDNNTAEVVIGGTTYLVSSFFKPDAKGSVVDKISRMIERDAMLSAEKENVINTTGMSSR